ncbi:unnamed protein product [Schistocephalus solidus]|uniref:Uncharacterized protein n=1 Tax=Schistocephalus solidus TaxID=70667 RepID=A0A183S865_SCHSO|nr:unnamed protein product [Schistocephalus solidus]
MNRLSQVETKADLDLLPSLQETIRAMQQLSNVKAPGSDVIPAAIYKHGSSQLMNPLLGAVVPRTDPSGFQGRQHRPSVQEKGEPPTLRQTPRNLTEKIFARILLNRHNGHMNKDSSRKATAVSAASAAPPT